MLKQVLMCPSVIYHLLNPPSNLSYETTPIVSTATGTKKWEESRCAYLAFYLCLTSLATASASLSANMEWDNARNENIRRQHQLNTSTTELHCKTQMQQYNITTLILAQY